MSLLTRSGSKPQLIKFFLFQIYIYIYIYIYRNAPHMAYKGIPHICMCGTITWGERVSGMWGPPSLSLSPHVIVPHGANMRGTLICHMRCIFLIYIYIYIYIYIFQTSDNVPNTLYGCIINTNTQYSHIISRNTQYSSIRVTNT